ncbi:hypothetical protein D3C71_2114080 [compost metagenome]
MDEDIGLVDEDGSGGSFYCGSHHIRHLDGSGHLSGEGTGPLPDRRGHAEYRIFGFCGKNGHRAEYNESIRVRKR